MTAPAGRILCADDEPNILSLLRKVLGDEGYTVLTATGGREACAVADREPLDLVLVDLTMPDTSGLEVLKHIKEHHPRTPVMLMTAYASAETAVEAMKQGALDYLIKPFAMDELKLQIRRALAESALEQENRALREELARHSPDRILGDSPGIREALRHTAQVADAATTVLILGETGTGKELIARALHRQSLRKAGPFLAINCGAIPEALLERELFGHERGAFTGAETMRIGLLEAAAEGTLLLDEIAEMPPSLQVKLLRVLEGHAFQRVGGTRPITTRVRFVAATNKDLVNAITTGRFREDLYYRLNVFTIQLPPLRERGDDIVLLADHFLRSFTLEHGHPPIVLSDEARQRLLGYGWPGNVRELRNVIERAVLLCASAEIAASDLRLDGNPAGASPPSTTLTGMPFREARDAFEKSYLARVLEESGGNISRAADRIGLDRKNLEDKIRKHHLK